MREIKFRYRYEQRSGDGTKQIVTRFYNLDEIALWAKTQKGERLLSRDEFTGLKDAKGNDIYENDIVKFTTHDHSGVTTFIAPEFIVKTLLTENLVFNKTGKFSLRGYECKIIGNIYESPNLLEKSNA